MDSTHLHLMLNHFPIIGTLIGAGVMAFGYFSNSETTKKAALFTWFVMALLAIPVFLSGEPAEESVENLPGVSEAIIERHEEGAELAFWFMEALGLLSLAAIVIQYRTGRPTKTLTGLAFALSLATFALMARTGLLGGQIRHTEVRGGAAAAQLPHDGGGGEKDDD